MAEEIITALSQCNWLFVIARNSSFTYKGRNVDVRQIGRELGVRYEAAEGLLLVSRAVERGKEDSNVMWMAACAVWRLAQDAQRARESSPIARCN
jgi:hypothetical protein